ncbi:hypothetical protein [Proteus phage VTCCBPA139]|nr:hypothetical protein [Proteus phage 1]QNN97876.1 hypothetical protein [Proteus phage 2]QOC54984.1 hypothetical protein [Proteus phage M4H10_20]QVQ56938.1 hypothetical protein [Proteus phage VTCCBPA139]
MKDYYYFLQPGYVYSPSDHDEHYIGRCQLASLYQVPMAKCITDPDRLAIGKAYIVLKPSWGDYSLPKPSVLVSKYRAPSGEWVLGWSNNTEYCRTRCKAHIAQMPLVLETDNVLVFELPNRIKRRSLVIVDKEEYLCKGRLDEVRVKEVAIHNFDNVYKF